jgi:hypothetical protein
VINVKGNVTFENGSTVYGIGDGFAGPYGPGYSSGDGGTYGGRGGANSLAPYGSEVYPMALGSGSYESPYSGYGGGAVRVETSENIVVNGLFDMGGTGRPPGSGGSIFLIANSITGSGILNASGGYSDIEHGGGGG